MYANLTAMFRRWKARPVPLFQVQARSILSADRRQFMRFASAGQTSVRPAHPKHRKKARARVANVSCAGVRVVAEFPCRRGALLHVELPLEAAGVPDLILACVVHVAHVHGAQWSVGCSFIRELTYEELQSLL